MLETVSRGCRAAGGAPNLEKLRLFRVSLADGKLGYRRGSVQNMERSIDTSLSGLHFTNLPLLDSRRPPSQYKATEVILRRMLAVFCRHRPHFLLGMRCVLAFALGKLDYLHGACPPLLRHCHRVQIIINHISRALLRLPSGCPTLWLHVPPDLGGLGVPHVFTRAQLCYLRSFLSCLNSRNELIRLNVRHL